MKRSNKYIPPKKKRVRTKQEKELRTNIYSIIFGTLLFGSCFIYYKYKSNQLKNEGLRTKGVILGTVPGGKAGPSTQFTFWVQGEKHISNGAHSVYDTFETGDTCYVIYARSNPSNCELERIEVNGHKMLKIKRRVK